jgi:FKBP-type peptidyl-prolyl cis-trans isomerase SlyD
MQIGAKKAVTLTYTLKNDAGEVLGKSEEKEPLTYLHGVGNIVPGLEAALEGKAAGDKVEVTLTPEQGYGERDEKAIRNFPRRRLKIPDNKLQVGARFPIELEGGYLIGTVLALRGDYVTVDTNHPLAGLTLHFDVAVVEVRDATEEELAHGHVHGPGDHH